MEERRAATAIKLFGMTIQVPAAGEWPREAAWKIVGGDGSKKDPREETPSPASSSSLSSEVLGGEEEERDGEQKKKKNLQCPRCNSSATKFCYYNNYNVNQPRHFCKNCQRYWTAGGTMRNVPVGSGRRKTKLPSPGNHHLITITDDRRIHNETVLCFGSDAPGHAEKMEEQSVSSSKESDVNLNFSYPWISFFPATYLGKHSRNEEEQGMKKSSSARNGRDQYYKWLSNPKKQRIDDPAVGAAKSSLWAALELNNECDPMDAINGEGRAGLLKSLSSKRKQIIKARSEEASQILQANPAALSRSLIFHESSEVSRK